MQQMAHPQEWHHVLEVFHFILKNNRPQVPRKHGGTHERASRAALNSSEFIMRSSAAGESGNDEVPAEVASSLAGLSCAVRCSPRPDGVGSSRSSFASSQAVVPSPVDEDVPKTHHPFLSPSIRGPVFLAQAGPAYLKRHKRPWTKRQHWPIALTATRRQVKKRMTTHLSTRSPPSG